jgi:hypothetical protein
MLGGAAGLVGGGYLGRAKDNLELRNQRGMMQLKQGKRFEEDKHPRGRAGRFARAGLALAGLGALALAPRQFRAAQITTTFYHAGKAKLLRGLADAARNTRSLPLIGTF